MIQKQQLIEQIGTTSLPDKAKSLLVQQVPDLGSAVTMQVYNLTLSSKLNRPFEQKHILGLVEVAVNVQQQLNAGKVEEAARLLSNASKDRLHDFGKDLLGLCEDLRGLSKGNHSTLDKVISDIEVKYFRQLSLSELKQIVSYDILIFIRDLSDIVAEFRYVYYIASPEYDAGQWAYQFLPLLQKNQQLFGERIKVGEQELAPTVEHWLKEYDLFAGKPGPQRQALDRLHFVQNNPNSKALSKEDQGVLLKLCELYDWLSDPYVTETEVSEFEDIAPATSRPGYMAEAPGVLGSAILEADTGPQDPNVQGVLVQTPIGVSKSGLEMSGRTPSVSEQPKDPVFVGKVPQKPVSVVSSNKQQIPKPSKSPEPPQEAGLTNLPKPRTLPPLVPPPMPKKSPVASQKTSAPLNMDRIKAEVEKKRDEVQGGIDKKLDELKKKE